MDHAWLVRMGQRVAASCCLNADAGKLASEWAMQLLENGYEQDSVLILASETAPFYWSEIKPMAKRVVSDLGREWPENEEAAKRMLARYYVEELVENRKDIDMALETLSQMYIEIDPDHSLFDFFLLWHGVESLKGNRDNYYWDGLTLLNSDVIIVDVAQKWLAAYDGA